MDEQKKELENLNTELFGLKIRLKRIEEYLSYFKDADAYIYDGDSCDELFEEAKKEVVKYDKATASLFQRKFSIGYSRAARILDQLESIGIVGPGEGARPRDVLIRADELNKYAKDESED